MDFDFAQGIRTEHLKNLGVIRATGADARAFLHSQLTQDVQNLSATDTQLAGYCSAKGRLYAVFQVFAVGEMVYLLTQRELIEGLLKRLRMFVLRAKVIFADVSDEWHIQGICAADALTVQQMEIIECGFRLGVLPAWIDGVAHPRELRLNTILTDANSNAQMWDWLDVMAGQPHITNATSEAFVPQMVNLDRIGGVNFKKGCYPGQEVVARSHYLGKLKRRMQMACCATDENITVGADVYSSIEPSQPAGQVVGAANHAGSTYILYEISLPLLADEAQLSVEGVSASWQPLALPYALADA